MYKSLLFKEWVKTRRIILMLLIVFTAIMLYIFINIGQLIRVNGIIAVWNSIILKDITLIDYLQWLPLLSGLLLALGQFVPEMYNKKIKLTLHLPMQDNYIVGMMLFFALAVQLILFLMVFIGLFLGLGIYFPREIIYSNMLTVFPWFIAGWVGYLLSAWICVEPQWKQRFINMLVALAILSFFYFDAKYGAYLSVTFLQITILVVSMFFPFHSIGRYKNGLQ